MTVSNMFVIFHHGHHHYLKKNPFSSQQRVRDMPKALKKSRRTSLTQLLRSSPKKSLRSWRCLGKYLSLVGFLLFFPTGCEGDQPYERRTVTLAVNDPAIHTDIYTFHKKILKYTYLIFCAFIL